MDNGYEQNNGTSDSQNTNTNSNSYNMNRATEYTGENPFFNLNDYYQNQQTVNNQSEQSYTQSNDSYEQNNNQYQYEQNITQDQYSSYQQQYTDYNTEYTQYSTNQVDQEVHDSDNNNGFDEPKKNKGKKVISFIAKAAVFGLVAGVVFLGTNEIYYKINPDAKQSKIIINADNTKPDVTAQDNNANNGSNSIETTKVTNSAISTETDVSDVVEEAMPSIVAITSTMTQSYNDWFGQNYSKDVQGSGSGIIIGKNDTELLVATNNHVVADAKAIAVQFIDTKVYQATIKGTDSTADLAVVAIKLKDISDKSMDAIKIASLGNSDTVRVGERVIAIGNALGYGQSITVGYISAKDREVKTDTNTMKLLQTDAAINPGNSGGALLNMNGEVIGINSIKYADNSVEGMGFAIPITHANPIIDDLKTREKIKEGEEGFVGIQGMTVTQEMIDTLNMVQGVYIKTVFDGGSAKEAGIVPRDIITKINGTDVTTIEAMIEKVSGYRAGTKIEITYQRLDNGEYKEHTVEVTLKKRSEVNTEEAEITESNNDTDSSKNDPGTQDKENKEVPNEDDGQQQTDPFSDFFSDPFFDFGN